VLSTYNISNAIGMQLVDERWQPTPAHLDLLLRKANVRFYTPLYWQFAPNLNLFRNYYWPRLEDPWFERSLTRYDLSRRTGVFEQLADRLQKEPDTIGTTREEQP